MKRSIALLLLLVSCAVSHVEGQTLEAFARLPADTFRTGPTSGQFIAPANGRIPPFVDKQPVQGNSAVLDGSGHDFWVMPDNGFGAKENSVDYVLGLYRIDPRFRTRQGGAGTIEIEDFIALRDDNNYPGSAGRTPGQSDPNEFIIIRLDRPLPGGKDDDHHGRGR